MIETIKTTDNMKFYKLFLLGIAIVLASCNASERVLYIQDMESGAEVAIPDNYIIRLKPMDQITVVVNSQDPELAVPFNTSTGLSSISGTPDSGSSNVNYLQIMTIDKEGYLDMPVIGKVKIAGLTRDEAESAIEKKIIDGGYDGKTVVMGIRPEDVYDDEETVAANADTVIESTVRVYELLGAEVYLYFDYAGANFTARVKPNTTARTGDHIKVALEPSKIHVFDKETEMTITN